MSERFLGLMSGTSLDAIDVALGDFSAGITTVSARSYPIEPRLRRDILDCIKSPERVDLRHIGDIDARFGLAQAEAARNFFDDTGLGPAGIVAIGMHGQTIWHAMDSEPAWTWQIGDPNRLTAAIGLPVVADLRRKDVALGGQGAPMVPAFHATVFANQRPCAVVNIGGMANITLLEDDIVRGFDTGPGNALMDEWFGKFNSGNYDKDGEWARSGTPDETLLERLLADPFFEQLPPRSTGRERFNFSWLDAALHGDEKPADVQATLAELTATSIASDLHDQAGNGGVTSLIVVGGGAHNSYLLERLQSLLPDMTVVTSARYGVDPDYVEAMAFAWLARETLAGRPGNLPSVTGASRSGILGGIYLP